MEKGKAGSQTNWKHFRNHEKVHRRAKAKNKKSRPMLGLISSGTDHFILSADFDQIPLEISMNLKTPQDVEKFWEDLYESLQSSYGDQTIICRSYSNKVKIFIPFVMAEGFLVEEVSRFTKESILKQFLLKEHHWFDNTVAGMDVAYLDPTALKLLPTIGELNPVRIYTEEQLVFYRDTPSTLFVPNDLFVPKSSLSGFSRTKPTYDGLSICKLSKERSIDQISTEHEKVNNVIDRNFYRYEGKKLPKGVSNSKILSLKGGKELMRRLLLAKHLNRKQGYGLPTHKLAEECKVSVPQISKMLKVLSEEGNLECIDSRSIYGKRARIYVASGALRKEIHLLFEESSKTPKPFNFPKQISDGAWEKTLYAIAKHLPNKEDFKNYALNLNGIEEKDRIQKVERILNRWDEI